MKRLRPETKAGIFIAIWEAFLYLGFIIEFITGTKFGYRLWLLDTAVQITMLVYDTKITHLERSLKSTRQKLAQQSAEYTEHVRSQKTITAKIFDISSRRRKGA